MCVALGYVAVLEQKKKKHLQGGRRGRTSCKSYLSILCNAIYPEIIWFWVFFFWFGFLFGSFLLNFSLSTPEPPGNTFLGRVASNQPRLSFYQEQFVVNVRHLQKRSCFPLSGVVVENLFSSVLILP